MMTLDDNQAFSFFVNNKGTSKIYDKSLGKQIP